MITITLWLLVVLCVAGAVWFGRMVYLSFVIDATEMGPPAFIFLLLMLAAAYYCATFALYGLPPGLLPSS